MILSRSLRSLRLCQLEYLSSKQGVAGLSSAGGASFPNKLDL